MLGSEEHFRGYWMAVEHWDAGYKRTTLDEVWCLAKSGCDMATMSDDVMMSFFGLFINRYTM